MRLDFCVLCLAAGLVLTVPVMGGQSAHQGQKFRGVQTRAVDQKLFEAIEKNDAKGVKRLLENGANPNATEANGWPAIVEAAAESVEVVQLLLAKGADVNARQPDQGWTPLTQALSSSKTDVALYLLGHGADPSLPMTGGLTPLHMAVRFGNDKAVEALLKRNVNVNARTKEDPNVVHDARSDEQAANVFEPGFRDSGRTPLFELVPNWRGHPGIARMLLDAGADSKAVDDNGWTLLHYAAETGSEFSVDALLKLGLDPNARSRQGFTPLHVAVRAGFGAPALPVIRRLLAAGADPTVRNKQGKTPEDLLREGAARMLGSLNLSPKACAANPEMRQALDAFNDALRVIHPGATAIDFPKAPVVDGWSLYPPIDLGGFGPSDEAGARVERRVRSASGRTELSLIYKSGPNDPPSISVHEIELNAYEPLDGLPLTLQANKERVVLFPGTAEPFGGSVWMKYSFKTESSSGGGEVGDTAVLPNPGFTSRETPKGWVYAVVCDTIWRPLEFRIDKLSVDGKELKQYRGKVILVRPPSGAFDPMDPLNSATPLVTIRKNRKNPPKLGIRYSYRLVGNRKWRTGSTAY